MANRYNKSSSNAVKMSLLPTPNSLPINSSGKILPNIGRFRYRQQHQLLHQPYLLVNPDQSMYQNYYLVYVPLIGSPSISIPHMVASTMSTSILQASTLLNSLLTATSVFNTSSPSSSSLSSALMPKPNSIPTTSYSSSIAHIREQYRYNMRPSYRYVPLCVINSWRYLPVVHIFITPISINFTLHNCMHVCFVCCHGRHSIWAHQNTLIFASKKIRVSFKKCE